MKARHLMTDQYTYLQLLQQGLMPAIHSMRTTAHAAITASSAQLPYLAHVAQADAG
jgi:hypothetical protein